MTKSSIETTSQEVGQQSEGKPLREQMPDEVDRQALQMWIQDFLFVSPPETDREYKGISWVDEQG